MFSNHHGDDFIAPTITAPSIAPLNPFGNKSNQSLEDEDKYDLDEFESENETFLIDTYLRNYKQSGTDDSSNAGLREVNNGWSAEEDEEDSDGDQQYIPTSRTANNYVKAKRLTRMRKLPDQIEKPIQNDPKSKMTRKVGEVKTIQVKSSTDSTSMYKLNNSLSSTDTLSDSQIALNDKTEKGKENNKVGVIDNYKPTSVRSNQSFYENKNREVNSRAGFKQSRDQSIDLPTPNFSRSIHDERNAYHQDHSRHKNMDQLISSNQNPLLLTDSLDSSIDLSDSDDKQIQRNSLRGEYTGNERVEELESSPDTKQYFTQMPIKKNSFHDDTIDTSSPELFGSKPNRSKDPSYPTFNQRSINSTVPPRNPLDESIETTTFRSGYSRRYNPLDESLEFGNKAPSSYSPNEVQIQSQPYNKKYSNSTATSSPVIIVPSAVSPKNKDSSKGFFRDDQDSYRDKHSVSIKSNSQLASELPNFKRSSSLRYQQPDNTRAVKSPELFPTETFTPPIHRNSVTVRKSVSFNIETTEGPAVYPTAEVDDEIHTIQLSELKDDKYLNERNDAQTNEIESIPTVVPMIPASTSSSIEAWNVSNTGKDEHKEEIKPNAEQKEITSVRIEPTTNYDMGKENVGIASLTHENNLGDLTTPKNYEQTDNYRSTATNDIGNNPLRYSTTSTLTSSYTTSSKYTKPFQTLSPECPLPPLTEYAKLTGVIMEGWLNKKSAVTGLWQKRYFVLSESTQFFCILRIYANATETLWGTVPLRLRTSIPIVTIESVQAVSKRTSQGKEFVIKFYSSENIKGGLGVFISSRSNQEGSDNGSQNSDILIGNKTKETVLQAPTAQARLLWIMMLSKALDVTLEELLESEN